MVRFFRLCSVILLVFLVVSCKKTATTTTPITTSNFMGNLSGANETIANSSTASGMSMATFDSNTKILTVTTTYYGITPTAGHIHRGAVGISGPVIYPFPNLTSPIVYSTPALSDSDVTNLMTNKLYVNFHSTAYPGGEIRAQLTKY